MSKLAYFCQCVFRRRRRTPLITQRKNGFCANVNVACPLLLCLLLQAHFYVDAQWLSSRPTCGIATHIFPTASQNSTRGGCVIPLTKRQDPGWVIRIVKSEKQTFSYFMACCGYRTAIFLNTTQRVGVVVWGYATMIRLTRATVKLDTQKCHRWIAYLCLCSKSWAAAVI